MLEIHILGNDPLDPASARWRHGLLGGIQFAIVGASSRGITEDFIGRVQRLSAGHRVGGSVIKIRVMMLGQKPVGGANLLEAATAVEAQRGVMIGQRAFQFPTLPCELSIASLIPPKI